MAAASTEELRSHAVASDPYPWILHPVIDMLFCCGGFLCLLLTIIVAGGFGQTADLNRSWLGLALLYLNIGGQYIIASSHQPATLWRVYVSKSTRETIGPFVTLSGLLFLACGIYALFNRDFTGILVRVTLAWSVQHTLAQAYGVALIYCLKRKYYLSQRERNIFYWMFQTGLVYLVVRMFTYTNFLQGDLYGLRLPILGPLPQCICATALLIFQLNTLLFAGMVIRKWWRDKVVMPMPALATTIMAFATLSFTFVLPAAFVIFIPTFYHASQYLVVTTAYYLKERGLPEDTSPSRIAKLLASNVVFNYIVIVAATGALLYIGLPRLLYEVGFDKSVCLCVVYCIFNLHHYMTDAAIWRIRDPQVRRLLVA
jgi:hypothetical protein